VSGQSWGQPPKNSLVFAFVVGVLADIGIFLLPFGQGTSALGTYGPKSGLFAVKSNDSNELSTGCRESLGAGLTLRTGRTQAFHLYRYFTDPAFGSDYR
jgi:hypothetical protein